MPPGDPRVNPWPVADNATVADEFKLVVLASGSGTNLQAILDTLHGREGIEVVGVASDKPSARALERAGAAGVETAVFPRDDYTGREARDTAITLKSLLDTRAPARLVPSGDST